MANNNNKDKCNVPNLRFPEFSGEWEMSSIGEQFELYSGNTPSRMNKNQFDGSINWITSGELKEHYISDTKEKISEEAAKNNSLKLLPVGTFVIAIYGLEANGVRGTCSITTRESTISQACMAFTSKMDIQNEFLYSWYKKHGNIIGIKYAQGTKQQNLSYDIIERFNISYPCMEEQKKLIRFISLIDQRIATQNKIIEDLKKLKSAIVDKLYSSTNGKTYSFCQLFEVVNEKNKKLAYKNVLSASQELGMIERSNINIDIKFEQESISGYKIVRKGDYVVHLRSFQGGFAFSDTTGICSPAYTILRPNDLVVYGYLSHFFTSKPFIKSLKLVTYGIRDGRSINVDEWLDMPILLPSAQEQMRILTIVNAIDAKLHNEAKVQFCLSSQKSYLLNTMFI